MTAEEKTPKYQAYISRVLCWVDPHGNNLGPVNLPKPNVKPRAKGQAEGQGKTEAKANK